MFDRLHQCYPNAIGGEAIIDGLAALLYANGQDFKRAETMAERLGKVVSGESEAVLMGRANDNAVDAVGFAALAEADAIHLETNSLAPRPDKHAKYADLVMPYDCEASFYLPNGEQQWLTFRHEEYVEPMYVNLEARKLSIFVDHDEARFHAESSDEPYMLVGTDEVLAMLSVQGARGALAAQRVLEARRDKPEGVPWPDTEGLDLEAAAVACMQSLASQDMEALPAEAHHGLLRQLHWEELLEVARTAVAAIPQEELAQSPNLTSLNLSSQKKVFNGLEQAAKRVVWAYTDHVGISWVNTDTLQRTLTRQYAQALPLDIQSNGMYANKKGRVARWRMRGRASWASHAYSD